MRYPRGVCSFLLILFVCSGLFAESSGETGLERLSLAFRQAVKKVKPAVVYLEVVKEGEVDIFGSKTKGSGSGVIIDGKGGYVLTANHVVEDTSRVKVRLSDGRTFIAGDIRADPQTDVAIVKIEPDNLPAAEFGDSDRLEVGDWVLAIGSPFGRGLENSVSAGIVSAKGRKTGVLGSLGLEDYVQTDAAINKGNSGGPLVDIRGRIVGINSSIVSPTGVYAGLGFAVPSNLIKPVVEKLIEEGEVVRGWLGITMVSLADAKENEEIKEKPGALPEQLVADGGAYVLNVHPDSPAEKSGMQKGDIIAAVDDEKIRSSAELVKAISSRSPGESVDCRIWRDGEEKSIRVKLGKRPEKLTPEQLGIVRRQDEKGRAYDKLGLVVSDFRGLIARRMGLSEMRAVIVDGVKSGSPADEFGIKQDEIITEVSGKKVSDSKAFEELVEKADLSKGVRLTILNAFGERKVIIKSGAD